MKPTHTNSPSSQDWLANPSLQELAQHWIAIQSGSGDAISEDDFFQMLAAFIAQWKPRIRSMNIAPTLLEEVCQDALILLHQSHLAGSKILTLATRSKATEHVERALLLTINSALRFSVARRLSEHARRNMAERKLQDELTQRLKSDASLTEAEGLKEVALTALLQALAQNRIDRIDAEILRLQIEDGLTQSEAGEQLTMSRQAACQREARALPVVRRIVQAMEGRE